MKTTSTEIPCPSNGNALAQSYYYQQQLEQLLNKFPTSPTVASSTTVAKHKVKLKRSTNGPQHSQQRHKRKCNNRHNSVKSYFHLLPFELIDKVIHYLPTSSLPLTLLYLNELNDNRNNAFKANTLAMMSHRLSINEQIIPNLSRWVRLTLPFRSIDVSSYINKYPKSTILPSLFKLFSNPHSSSITSVRMPILPEILPLVVRIKSVSELGLYFKTKFDIHCFMNVFKHVQLYNVRHLTLSCVQNSAHESHDSSTCNKHASDPFCLTNSCVLELLATYIINSRQFDLAKIFPNMYSLTLSCYHKLPCDLWYFIHSFPKLNALSLNSPIAVAAPNADAELHRNNSSSQSIGIGDVEDAVMEEANVRDLNKLKNLNHLDINIALNVAMGIGSCVKTLISTDRLYTMTELNELFTCCPLLKNLEVSLDSTSLNTNNTSNNSNNSSGGVQQNGVLLLPSTLEKLVVYADYTDLDININNNYSTYINEYKPMNLSTILNEYTPQSLKSLHVYYCQINLSDLTNVFNSASTSNEIKLKELGMSLNLQQIHSPFDMFVYMCHFLTSATNTGVDVSALKSLRFNDINNHYTPADGEKERQLWVALWTLKRQLKSLNFDHIEHVVMKLLGDDFMFHNLNQQLNGGGDDDDESTSSRKYNVCELLPSLQYTWC